MLKKIIIGFLAFVFLCIFTLNTTYDHVVAKAESYNVEYTDCGRIVSLRSIVALNDQNKVAEEELYNEAKAIYDNLIALGANPNDIPVVLYSDVTSSELELLKDYEQIFLKNHKAGTTKSDTPVTEIDSDDDGVNDLDDVCPDFDDTIDDDLNGVPDGCEIDSDEDGVLDEEDICDGFDDTLDFDADGTPDDCDSDSDNDTVEDTYDICDGYDDTIDDNYNAVPDGCDYIEEEYIEEDYTEDDSYDDESLDSEIDTIDDDYDDDGIIDSNDRCPEQGENIDSSGCPIEEPEDNDSDDDGVPDELDICDDYDDSIDTDGNGNPDGCDVPVVLNIVSIKN